MKITLLTPQRIFLTLCITLAGCASTQPLPYSNLASAPQLRPNPDDTSGRIPYRISSNRRWQGYSKAIVDSVVIYKGADNQFEDISEYDKATLADYMQTQFMEKLKTRFDIVNNPTPKTLRVHLTLTGAKSTTRVLSTFFNIAGGPYNIIQAIRGKEGTFTGSVSYAVEVFDASSNALLDAYVTKQYPSPMNIKASLGTLDASMTGIEKGADELVAQFK